MHLPQRVIRPPRLVVRAAHARQPQDEWQARRTVEGIALGHMVMVVEHLTVVRGEYDGSVVEFAVLKQRLEHAVEAVVDMADLGIISPPRIVALCRIGRNRAIQSPHR